MQLPSTYPVAVQGVIHALMDYAKANGGAMPVGLTMDQDTLSKLDMEARLDLGQSRYEACRAAGAAKGAWMLVCGVPVSAIVDPCYGFRRI